MPVPSEFTRKLEEWTKSGGDLYEILGGWTNRRIKKPQEARAVCNALVALRQNPALNDDNSIARPFSTLAGYFQSVASAAALEVFAQEGLPLLRERVAAFDLGMDVANDDILFIIKILAMYRQSEDLPTIVAAARKPLETDSYMWSVIFGQFEDDHPLAVEMVDRLRAPLPDGFILVTYLDMANRLAIAGRLFEHPFDNAEGIAHLNRWLCATDPEEYSYAHSATAALPFIHDRSRRLLLDLAALHPSPEVRMEAAWAQARTGDEDGVRRLVDMSLQPALSQTAQTYLNELGRGDAIPDACNGPEFLVLAEMAGWLSHPMEFGRPPDKIEIFDTRSLYWPPTKTQLDVALVKYQFNSADGAEPDIGVGMVGSTTFALFSDSTAELSPEDIYALHCCWELGDYGELNVPKERYIATGRQLLREHNEGF
jgi:hypothetical protein